MIKVYQDIKFKGQPSDRDMRIAAIETSGRYGSVAVLAGEGNVAQVLHETRLGETQRTAQSLAPALRDLLSRANWSPGSVGLVAVAIGPGSFTGLRIGITTAKAFAYAVGAEIVGVNTLAVLAAQTPQSPSLLWTIMDAQRQELFAAKFDNRDVRGRVMTKAAHIIPHDQWLAGLEPGEWVTGPALRQLAPRLPSEVVPAPKEGWEPTAAGVGQLSWQLYRTGQRDDVWKLSPEYYRPSAAEEKLARRQ
jgi:tRNA threonylcarbamoyladenosine biosynthesis protein TsaB